MLQGVFSVQGHRLHFSADGQGSPLVLIHGLSGSAHWWRRNLPALRLRHRVYTLELSGYGQARRQRALGVREAAQVIAAWLNELNLTGVTLIGHSMGGQIAIHVASQCPERVGQLVLVCASGLLKSSLVRAALHLPRAAWVGKKRFLPRVMTDAVRAGPLNLWRSTTDLLGDSVAELIPALRVRTLLVWGERDPLVPVPLGHALARGIPGAQLVVIAGAGHIPMVDQPERFNEVVLSFLATADAA